MSAARGSIDGFMARRGLPPQMRSPRARALPGFVASRPGGLAKPLGPQSFVPVEHEGAQPGFAMPFFAPVIDSALDIDRAVQVIRLARGVGPDRPCQFPDDLGCETQLYLGLALCRIRPEQSLLERAEACKVARVDALFFETLLECARAGTWVRADILDRACEALNWPTAVGRGEP